MYTVINSIICEIVYVYYSVIIITEKFSAYYTVQTCFIRETVFFYNTVVRRIIKEEDFVY